MAHFNELHFRRGLAMAFDARTAALIAALLVNGSAMSAILTVTDTGDAGDGTCDATCTLRDAVNAAQADDRVLFDLALSSPIVIGLTGPALQIDLPMRIVGTDGVRTTLRRTSGSGRLIDVLNGGDVRIVGLSFENGTAPSVPASGADGGAVFVAAGAALELRDCVFRDNLAIAIASPPEVAMQGGTARGGAIYAEGDLLVENCAFVGNLAQGGNGSSNVFLSGNAGGAASGGAIHAIATADILNSTFSGNRASGGDGGGGGIGMIGMPGFNGGDGGGASGGALAFSASAAPTLAFSTLIANIVEPGDGGPGGPAGPPLMPELPPPPNGANGATGAARAAAIDSAATTIINVSVIAANTGATPCAGAALGARTSNRVDDASCPGIVVNALETQFEPIDAQADSPHFKPLFGSAAVDAAADCLDAVAFEVVDLDQLLTPRPLAGHGGALACDFGAIELNPVLFGDGFEEPPPPP
ncbi:MAG TPA: hypothetical protein VN581_13480 [Patescibacteria group bacterium]|nr:hypothetical protein [Patescibacteria group bacterium]